MLRAYVASGDALVPIEPSGDRLEEAIWIDLCQPDQAEVAAVEALGIKVPERSEMEELQLSSRLYRLGDVGYMTVVVSGLLPDARRASRPVCIILASTRMVTVRFHEPPAFVSFPLRVVRVGAGCNSAFRACIGLVEELVDQIADGLEEIGTALSSVSDEVFDGKNSRRTRTLERALRSTGKFGARIGATRHSLLTFGRAVNYLQQYPPRVADADAVQHVLHGQTRDIDALVVHADYLASRAAVIADATLGIISLEQNKSVSILSALAALFAPAMLISSIYGMNFSSMPDINSKWGFTMAVAGMALSSLATYLFFKKRGWM